MLLDMRTHACTYAYTHIVLLLLILLMSLFCLLFQTCSKILCFFPFENLLNINKSKETNNAILDNANRERKATKTTKGSQMGLSVALTSMEDILTD